LHATIILKEKSPSLVLRNCRVSDFRLVSFQIVVDFIGVGVALGIGTGF
jgi:hypothetical protein